MFMDSFVALSVKEEKHTNPIRKLHETGYEWLTIAKTMENVLRLSRGSGN